MQHTVRVHKGFGNFVGSNCFFMFLDDYCIAREKARKAEYTSDLNTDSEYGIGKRKGKRLVFSESSSESEELVRKKKYVKLPPPPKKRAQPFLEAQNCNKGNLVLFSEIIIIVRM